MRLVCTSADDDDAYSQNVHPQLAAFKVTFFWKLVPPVLLQGTVSAAAVGADGVAQ